MLDFNLVGKYIVDIFKDSFDIYSYIVDIIILSFNELRIIINEYQHGCVLLAIVFIFSTWIGDLCYFYFIEDSDSFFKKHFRK